VESEGPAMRVHLSPPRFRVPDVTVLDQDGPKEQIITHAALAVFEILSAEDTVTRLLSKLADYAAMGIEGIFVIDPATNAYYIYQRGSLDHIGGLSTVSRCKIDFDDSKGLLAQRTPERPPLSRHHRQQNARRRILRAIDLLRRFHIIGVGSFVDIVYKLLRIAVVQWKPGALHLHHNAMSLEKHMVV
jgi:hypothetical protein